MRRFSLIGLAVLCGSLVALVGSTVAPGAQSDAADIAANYVEDNKQELGLTGADVNDMRVTNQVVDSGTGTTHVYFQQVHKGIGVHKGLLTVNVAAAGWVVSVGNRFVSNLAAAAGGQSTKRADEAAGAAARHVGLAPQGLRVIQEGSGPSKKSKVSTGGVAAAPIDAELVWQRVDNGVRLAWNVEIDEASGEHLWSINVDAETGAVLQTDDFVDEDTVDGIAAAIARPSGVTTMAVRTAAATVADGSSYNVFGLPLESPSDGGRSVVQNPADENASPFGWHDTNGAAGAEFTRTRGNNVHAYADRDNNNVADPGTDPDGGAGLDFDFPLDLTDVPLDYRDAAVTNLFYWNNIVHDVLYQHGFDEAAGNFQVNNYGNGGLGNDDVRAEAQDGSGRNNANFGTPVDGQRPRMQMFEWRSAAPNPIVVRAPSPIAGTYFGPMAGFGDSLATTGPISGQVVYVGRGCDPAYQAGQPLDPYLVPAAGKIALIDRGSCTFAAKVKKAEDQGAVMVIVANNAPGPAIAMSGADPTITIPSVMVTQDDGNRFRSNVPFDATISDGTGGAPERDSDLDAGVIAHEYGHGWSNRLTGGPATVSCLQNAEQMGEGWSDFLAMTFTAVPSDTPTTARGVGTYVSFQASTEGGIRPRPYTTDTSVNEFTYGSIPGGVASGVLTVPHGIGFVWNTMLNEVYWNLVAKHGFNPDIYGAWSTGGNNLALRLVSDGLKSQPCSPGFVDGRNGILAADLALTGGENQCAIWRGFAKRGLGFGAAQGSSNSVTDGSPSFNLPVTCTAQFGGFQPPIAAPPVLNQANAGSTVPTKFTLSEQGGAPDIAAVFASQQVDCGTRAPTGPIVPALTPGSRVLQSEGNQYSFNWKTDSAWAGTCRQLIIRLQDVTDPVAFFRFR
ncbi:MAG TPA: M36 family metallopeptidase [Gaiella sp.]|uniref:M36 family metallopeptidase n=1 Tax=Gaiella sp. TaxID=2663207 RepID=UPI002D806DAA|nr:M36 family metallopeptidase [Gaiella sp.]HET9286378.1 M36 family metallopeptidase [Gaiella sp.]